MGKAEEWGARHRPYIQGRMSSRGLFSKKSNFGWKDFLYLPIEPQQVGKNAQSGDRQGNRS